MSLPKKVTKHNRKELYYASSQLAVKDSNYYVVHDDLVKSVKDLNFRFDYSDTDISITKDSISILGNNEGQTIDFNFSINKIFVVKLIEGSLAFIEVDKNLFV